MRNFSPADERQPQGLPTCISTLTMRACSGTSAKKLAQHGASSGSPAKKLARHGTSSGTSAKKLAQHARKQHFSAILGSQGELFRAPQWERRKQGELFRARSHSRPSRANYFAFRRHVRDAGRRISRTGLDAGRRNMATLKPTTPLLASSKGPLKPTSPLRPKTAPKTPFSLPQRRWRFQSHAGTSEQRRSRFQTTGPPGRHRLAATPAGGRARLRPLGGDDTTAPKFRMQFDWVKFQ